MRVKNGKSFENRVLVLKTVIFTDFPVTNLANFRDQISQSRRIWEIYVGYFPIPGAKFPSPGVNLGNNRMHNPAEVKKLEGVVVTSVGDVSMPCWVRAVCKISVS